MMKAEVTAENRPACNQVGTRAWYERKRGTHEDQSGVQILIVFLHELPIVLVCLLAVVLKEPSPMIYLKR